MSLSLLFPGAREISLLRGVPPGTDRAVITVCWKLGSVNYGLLTPSPYSGLTPAMHFSLETSGLQGSGSVFAETWGPVAKVKSFLAARDERSLSSPPAADEMWTILQNTVLCWQGPQQGFARSLCVFPFAESSPGRIPLPEGSELCVNRVRSNYRSPHRR